MRKSKNRKSARLLRGKEVEKLNRELYLKRREARHALIEKHPTIFTDKEKTLSLKEMRQIIAERVKPEIKTAPVIEEITVV